MDRALGPEFAEGSHGCTAVLSNFVDNRRRALRLGFSVGPDWHVCDIQELSFLVRFASEAPQEASPARLIYEVFSSKLPPGELGRIEAAAGEGEAGARVSPEAQP